MIVVEWWLSGGGRREEGSGDGVNFIQPISRILVIANLFMLLEAMFHECPAALQSNCIFVSLI